MGVAPDTCSSLTRGPLLFYLENMMILADERKSSVIRFVSILNSGTNSRAIINPNIHITTEQR